MYRHAQLVKLGLDKNPIWVSRLINQIVSAQTVHNLFHAHQLFDQITRKDTVLWTSLISAYSRFNQPHRALELFSVMTRRLDPDGRPNQFTFSTVATAIASCCSVEHLDLGRTVHGHVIKLGFIPNAVVLETALVDMYAKCGALDCACRLFDEMPVRNLVTWNAMVGGCIRNRNEIFGFELFSLMKSQELLVPDEFSISTALTGCANVEDVVLGMQVHGYAVVRGLEQSCTNSIAYMYFRCGEVTYAERVLNGLEGDVMLKLLKFRGYIINKRYGDALNIIDMEDNLVEILNSDYTIVVPLLTACANLSLLKMGKQVHAFLIIFGIDSVTFHFLEETGAVIGSALIDMYSKCSHVNEARKVFENWLPIPFMSQWNSMVACYIYNGLIDDARILLEDMPEKDVVSWTTMITGYVHNGNPQEGLNLLRQMYSSKEGPGVDGNCLTFVVGLEACSYLTDLAGGKQIHAKLIRLLTNAYINNVIVGTALVDMYCKSGSLSDAQTVFSLMSEKNVIAWTSIITGYAIHGFGLQALNIFQQMMDSGVAPNEVTFVAVLTACSHCGLVDDGLYYFNLMKEKYGLVPREDHFTCLVDMLGRVGRLEEAWSLMAEIADKDINGNTIWAAMLGACHLHGNVEMGKMVAKKMLETGMPVSTTHITLYNVYAAAGMWTEAYGVREGWKKDHNADSEPGLSRMFARPGLS